MVDVDSIDGLIRLADDQGIVLVKVGSEWKLTIYDDYIA